MGNIKIINVLLIFALAGCAPQKGVHFEPTVESLRQYQVPEWFKDAKFGIYCHWNADKLDASKWVELIKDAGANYVITMAVHHDNFDFGNSKYQPRWNRLHFGPKADGSFGDASIKIRKDFGVWLRKYGESIYGTQNWTTFGERDIRFTIKDNNLYVICWNKPSVKTLIESPAVMQEI